MGHGGRKDSAAGSGKAVLTRRALLELAGLTFATTVIPCGFAAGTAVASEGDVAQGVSPVMDKLSRYMSEASERVLPDEVAEKAKHHILDTLAAMISGSEIRPGRAAIEFARAYGGKEVATVVASNIVCGAIEAALANGVLAHADETDDSHGPSRSHPGVSVIPAALAAGEQFGISGKHFLRAVTLGYDVGTRVTMSMGGPAYQAATHRSTHGTVAAFAAGAAAGSAASLNAQQMRLLLDYSAQQTSGIGAWSRDAEHMEKAFLFGGKPAAGAVMAATLIHAGWSGVPDIFSGPDNFFEAFAPRENGVIKADPAALTDKLGERYEVARTNIKKWTVGSPIQAPLDALAGFFKQRKFSADDVSKVVVRVANTEARVVDNREMPDICLQHMVAVMLLDKTASFRAAHDKPRMKDPAVLRVRDKVQLIPSDELEKMEPARQAIVEITLNDGTVLSEHVTDVRGTVDNPMTREEVVQKCRDLVEPVLGKANCTNLIDKVIGIEKVTDIRELRSVLQKA